MVTRDNPQHRRSVLVTLTAAGRRAFARVRASELVEMGELAAGRSDAQLRTAAPVLADLDRDVRTKADALREGA